MRHPQSTQPQTPMALKRALLGLGAWGLSWLSGCTAPPAAPTGTLAAPQSAPQSAPEPVTRPAASAAPKPDAVANPNSAPNISHSHTVAPPSPSRSAARNARDYRKDAASHLYARHSQHVYKGRLPPMLQAVGVLNVEIDRHGAVQSVHWTRAPRHVPQVMQNIERMVKAAAPYPLPLYLSQVTYTDVWLWHQSGQFQLDTLTEGQD